MHIRPITMTAILCLLLGIGCGRERLERHEFVELVMASPARLVIYAEDERTARSAARMTYDRLHEIDRTLSDWNPRSERSRLVEAAPEPVQVSELLRASTVEALRLSRATGGAFDPTIGPQVALWRRSRETGILPTESERRRSGALVGIELIEVTEAGIGLGRRGASLDFGGIGKGIALDEAGRVLDGLGLAHHLIDLDGEIRAGQAPPGVAAWRVTIADESGDGIELALVGTTASTSGDLHQYVEIDGRRYSHVLDPGTGLGLTVPIQVTVVSDDGAVGDALATAGCVLGPERLAQLIEKEFPDVSAVVLQERDGISREFRIGRIPVAAPALSPDAP